MLRFEAETDTVGISDVPYTKLSKVVKLDEYARCSDCESQSKTTKICCSFCPKKVWTDHNFDACYECIDKLKPK